MQRPGELTCYEQIGEVGRQHALSKSFSDDDCGLNLMRLGALFNLLPPPPARILECGPGILLLKRYCGITVPHKGPGEPIPGKGSGRRLVSAA